MEPTKEQWKKAAEKLAAHLPRADCYYCPVKDKGICGARTAEECQTVGLAWALDEKEEDRD